MDPIMTKQASVTETNPELLIEIRDSLPSDGLFAAVETFRLLTNPLGIKILYALFEGSLHLEDLIRVTHEPQTTVLEQLRILQDHSLIRSQGQDAQVSYSFYDHHIAVLLQAITAYVCHEQREGDPSL